MEVNSPCKHRIKYKVLKALKEKLG